MRKLLTLVLILMVNSAIYAQNFKYKIDQLVSTVIKDNKGPGAVFIIAKDGKVIYQKAFGKANLELGVNMNTNNVFQLGSMTKQLKFRQVRHQPIAKRIIFDLN